MNRVLCGECVYAEVIEDCGPLTTRVRRECRRRPPVLLSSGEFAKSCWPTVSATDWCGEALKEPS